MTPGPEDSRFIGCSVRRFEDAPLLRGEGRFVDNLSFPGMVNMRVVRSPIAHDRLITVDAAAALALPGVAAVWSGEDIAGLPPIGFRIDG